MTWIYLSPHLDDAAFSCGGLIAQQNLSGETAEIWTICAGDPPPGPFSPFAEALHFLWQAGREATALRRAEDSLACARLSAACRHLPLPDCIYRRAGLDYWEASSPAHPGQEPGAYLYPDRDAIFGDLHPLEAGLVNILAQKLDEMLPPEAEVVCPLTLGGHVDHKLARQAVELLGRRLWYYADYPYAREHGKEIATLEADGWRRQCFSISQTALLAWIQAIAAHRSQISTFWQDDSAMQADIQAYFDQSGGAILWKMV
jgi:LmbE family N-acetylglucosaminyl deacetylase